MLVLWEIAPCLFYFSFNQVTMPMFAARSFYCTIPAILVHNIVIFMRYALCPLSCWPCALNPGG